jgi:hypothetical protein
MASSIERLCYELKRLAGLGAQPKHCGDSPTLCELLGLSDVEGKARGCLAQKYLRTKIGSVESPVWYEYQELSAEQLKRVFFILFGFERSERSAPARRQAVIDYLGLKCSEQTFRKDREWDLCWLLADILLHPAKQPA